MPWNKRRSTSRNKGSESDRYRQAADDALQKLDWAQQFNDLYGTNHNKSDAFGNCVSKTAKALDQNANEAKSSWKTEQAADPEAFKNEYGTNKDKSNAYGKCVSAL